MYVKCYIMIHQNTKVFRKIRHTYFVGVLVTDDPSETGQGDKVVKTFRVTFTAEEWVKYKAVKQDLGLSADAEVIRFLINMYHKVVVVHGDKTTAEAARIFRGF